MNVTHTRKQIILDHGFLSQDGMRKELTSVLGRLAEESTYLVHNAFVAGQSMDLSQLLKWHQKLQDILHAETPPNDPRLYGPERLYVAALVLNALSTGAVRARRYDALGRLFDLKVGTCASGVIPVVHISEYAQLQLDEVYWPTPGVYEYAYQHFQEAVPRARDFNGHFDSVYGEAEILQVLSNHALGYRSIEDVFIGGYASDERKTNQISRGSEPQSRRWASLPHMCGTRFSATHPPNAVSCWTV